MLQAQGLFLHFLRFLAGRAGGRLQEAQVHDPGAQRRYAKKKPGSPCGGPGYIRLLPLEKAYFDVPSRDRAYNPLVRVYLDNCCLQRPLDDQTQPRIRVETEAVLAVLAAAQAGDLVLLTSEALEFEIGCIPDEQRRSEALAVLQLARERLCVSDEAERLAESLERQGLRGMDAMHLALASVAEAKYFASCDDGLVRKARSIKGLACKVVSVLGLVPEVTK